MGMESGTGAGWGEEIDIGVEEKQILENQKNKW